VTHFLAAGFIFDHIDDIGRGLGRLERLFEGWRSSAAAGGAISPPSREFDEAGRMIAALAARCREARRTLDTLESEPLIYTGSGATHQVIAMLEGLLARVGEDAPAAPAGEPAPAGGKAPASPGKPARAWVGKAMARAARRQRREEEG
jgi:hypothetical protein